jgi:hypothetical protein
MLRTDFGEKCIIVQFLRAGKERKKRLSAETQRKDLRKIVEEKTKTISPPKDTAPENLQSPDAALKGGSTRSKD